MTKNMAARICGR